MHALLTDRYQLTMIAAYRSSGMHRRRAVFEAFVRRLPPCRHFMLAAGIERLVDRVLGLRFEEDELAYLVGASGLEAGPGATLAEALADFRFRGDLYAVREGAVVFPNEPFLRVEGTLEEAQLVETLLLSIVNHDMRVASKAVRCVIAAHGRPVIEFGSRRTHEQAAVDAARAAFVAGCAGTSNERAGLEFGIPVYGTVAHSYIMAHADEGEEAAFRHYLDTFPDDGVLLVDTFDTLRGVELAIQAAKGNLKGIRLDSGDLASLSHGARVRLDAAGLTGTRILASNDLNEYRITELLSEGAPIDAFGVGTEIVCTPDMPALGAVYKLVAIEDRSGAMRPVAKRSSGKATYPGAKQVYRRVDAGCRALFDEVALANEQRPGRPLLVGWIRNGERTLGPVSLDEVRSHATEQVQQLPRSLKTIPEEVSRCRHTTYPVERSAALTVLYDDAVMRGGW